MCSLGIETGKIIGVHGNFKSYNDRMGFVADVVYGDPNQMKPERAKKVWIEVDQSLYSGREVLREIRSILLKHRGTAEVSFVVYPGTDEDGKLSGRPRKIVAGEKFGVDGSKELMAGLKECQSVYDVYSA
jgi:hypothetical protein